jgi:DNA modification methylase
MTEVNKIYNADCLDGLKSLPDDSIDCCITDPPYGIGYQSAWRIDKSDWKPKILNDEQPFIDWIEPLFKKLKTGGRLVCFYRWDVQNEFLAEISRVGFDVKSQIVWDKVSHGMGDLSGEFAPQHELMIYATKGRYEFKKKRPKTVYKCLRISGSDLIHPNEKPVPLLAAIIRDITTKGELVIDPFGGSFSTALAAHQEGRKFISYELHEEYFKIGQKRFNDLSKTQNLFAA